MVNFLRRSFINTSIFFLLLGIIILFTVKFYELDLLYFILGIIVLIVSIFKGKSKVQIIFLVFISLTSVMLINSWISRSQAVANKIETDQTRIIKGFVSNNEAGRISLIFASDNDSRLINKLNLNYKEKKDIDLSRLKPFEYIEIKTSENLKKFKKDELVLVLSNESKVHTENNFIAEIVNSLNNKIDSTADKYYGENSGLAKAMIFGIKDDLDPEDKKEFGYLGLSHVLVASGANIIMILEGINFIFSKLTFKYKRGWQFMIVLIYFLLVGVQGSISRAFFFFIINFISTFLGREIDYLQKIMLSIAFTIFIFPQLLFGLSFALSMIASVSIKFSDQLQNYFKIKNAILKNLLTNTVIILFVNVFIAYQFKTFNFAGLISNIIVLPLVEIIVTLGFAQTIVLIIIDTLTANLLFDLNMLLSIPFNFLLNIFIFIEKGLVSVLGAGMSYKWYASANDLFLIYGILSILWIFIVFKLYKRNISESKLVV